MKRCMLGIMSMYWKRNTSVKNMTRVVNIVGRVKRLKWQQLGLIAKVADDRSARMMPERM